MTEHEKRWVVDGPRLAVLVHREEQRSTKLHRVTGAEAVGHLVHATHVQQVSQGGEFNVIGVLVGTCCSRSRLQHGIGGLRIR
ncbi:hypothetical protein BC739_004018 [Kutzneria viridogrisea]|uniref:Uncharacterized protein n=1 Tax=Kutzneria viridogrisea TaxID=47990 RepID=A0ABR6BJI9_9PSEU|nr:hypothetical protein [Kutzneria viridogrisea]